MQTLAVMDRFDEAADLLARLVQIAIIGGLDLLALERFHDAFRHRIVIGAAGPAHRGLDAGTLQSPDIVAADLLHAAIGVVHQFAGHHVAPRQRHLERLQRQVGTQMTGHRPADHLAAANQLGQVQLFKTLRKFISARPSVHTRFSHEPHLNHRETFKQNRSAALAEWRQLAD